MERRAAAGLAFFLAAGSFFIVLFVAEASYPGYQVGANPISDLGATCPDGGSCVVHQPASTIFSGLMIALGSLVLAGVAAGFRRLGHRAMDPLLVLLGLAAIGVGLFNETWSVHGLIALVAFTAGPLAAIASSRALPQPLGPLALGLGVLSLVSLAWQLAGTFGGAALFGGLGDGGVERLIVYPEVLWLALLGVFLMTDARGAALGNQGERPAATTAG